MTLLGVNINFFFSSIDLSETASRKSVPSNLQQLGVQYSMRVLEIKAGTILIQDGTLMPFLLAEPPENVG